jgi:hypothetical protein
MPADGKPLPKQWPKRELGCQKTSNEQPSAMAGRPRLSKHFYRCQYQISGTDWRTIYYAIFIDWKGKRRDMRLGSEIKAAKDALAILEARNIKREDFDADKNRGMTLGEWLDGYLRRYINLSDDQIRQVLQ